MIRAIMSIVHIPVKVATESGVKATTLPESFRPGLKKIALAGLL